MRLKRRIFIEFILPFALLSFCATVTRAEVEAESGTPHLYQTPAEKREIAGIVLREGISMGGLIEVEASAGREQGENVSDVVLATFELGVEAELSKWLRGRALLLWEEDDTEPVELDEAVVVIGGSAEVPFYLEAGKMYVPFGTFSSHFISDPLVLELAETRESAIIAGYANDWVDIRAGAFNGDVDKEEDKTDELVAALTFDLGDWFQSGGYWISHIGESDLLEESLNENGNSRETAAPEFSGVQGAGGFVSLRVGRLVADAEYAAALEDFAAGTIGPSPARPVAWNAEAGLYFHGKQAEIALKFEGSDELPGFPEKQYGIGSSIKIVESVTVAIEFLHGDFRENDEDRDIVTTQLALEF